MKAVAELAVVTKLLYAIAHVLDQEGRRSDRPGKQDRQ
jgi:hypothetical protein